MNIASILVSSIVIVSFLSSCGNSTPASSKAKSNDVAEVKQFACMASYSDSKIQAEPLFVERFDAAPNTAATIKEFGVHPGDGKYFAMIAPNSSKGASDEVAIVIMKEGGVRSTSIFHQDSKKLFAILNLSDARIFAVVCTPKN